jgi:intron-binding protein aquarius
MRLIGFMPKDIVVLTTYRAQKQLLRDIFNQRCSHDRLFDLPSRVTTVDKFQGQQASIVLISLVRTRSVGHIRDTRRTVTALSRARYGLYIFGRWSLYASVHQLRPFFQRFEELPKQLALTPGEEHPTTRLETDPVDEDYKVENESVMREIVDDARQRAGEQEPK